MIIIGLCGRSGSGKGTVGRIFAEYSIPVLDTDLLYHDMINDSTSACTKALVAAFGVGILDQAGKINRSVLRKIVFSEGNEDKLQKLNSITHAYVLDATNAWIREKEKLGAKAICLDVPLLFESQMDKICDLTVAVVASDKTCVARIQKRDKVDVKTAVQRLGAQLSNEELTARCSYVIENDGSYSDLSSKVIKLLNEIL